MNAVQFLTNRNGTYYFRRVVPISLLSILKRREIVLTLKTDDFKDACMVTLEMSKELDGLFDRLKLGVGLITPPQQDIFTEAVKTHRTQELLREALELQGWIADCATQTRRGMSRTAFLCSAATNL